MIMASGYSEIRAVVRAVEGDQAFVDVAQGGCGRCHEQGGCGGQQLTQMFCGGQKSYRVRNEMGARVGDTVTVAIAAGAVRHGANLAYGLPVIGLVLGAVVGMELDGDLGAIFGAMFGLGVTWTCVRFTLRAQGGNSVFHPYIISRS